MVIKVRFIFNGTYNDLVGQIRAQAATATKNIIIDDTERPVLKIGFMRLGHSGGRWLIADSETKDNKTVLHGSFKDIYLSNNSSKIKSFFSELFIWIIIYAVFLIIPLVIWLLAFKTQLLFISFLIPAVILILLYLNGKRNDKKSDKSFIDFMENKVGCFYSED